MTLPAASRIALAACTILPIQAADSILPLREVTSEALRVPNQPVPGFYQGYVYFVDHGRITLYRPDGQLALSKEVQRPNERPLSVIGIAVDRNGTVAAAWSQFPAADGRFAGIDLMDAAGKPIRTIETGAYLPAHLAFDDEHSLWTFGWQRDDRDAAYPSEEYMTVRKYSSDGRQLASFVPRSLFPRGLQPAACANWQERAIQVGRDRIGLLACSGMTSAKQEWVEIERNGNLIGRWRIELRVTTVTLTRDGRVYAQNVNSKSRELLELDRTSSAFKVVEWPNTRILYGADDDELVFGDPQPGPIYLTWYQQPR